MFFNLSKSECLFCIDFSNGWQKTGETYFLFDLKVSVVDFKKYVSLLILHIKILRYNRSNDFLKDTELKFG